MAEHHESAGITTRESHVHPRVTVRRRHEGLRYVGHTENRMTRCGWVSL